MPLRQNLLGITQDVPDKGRSFLIAEITKHIDKDEIGELEDKGMSLFLILKDKIAEMKVSPDSSTPIGDTPDTNPARPQQTNNPEAQLSVREKLKKQVKALQLALQSLQQRDATQAPNQNTPHNYAPTQNPTQSLVNPWHREFKISGQIGEPGQKDKLTFSDLAHQIEAGLNKRVPEYEIVHAVVKAIAPGMQLRRYLEGKADLTLPVLRRILRSNYQEKGATELYKQLTTVISGL